MKRLFLNLVVVAVATLSIVGCDAFHSASSSDSSTGSPYEVVVVCDQQPWLSELGDTLQSVLQQPVKELPTYQAMFDVMRVLPSNFKSLTRHHRNVIVVHVNPEFKEPKIEAQYDATAAPQIFISIKGPDNQTLAKYVSDNRDNLLYVLEKAERDRRIDYSKTYYSRPLYEMIQKEFGIDMYVPDNFKMRTQTENMIWFSHELPVASQGFFIYKYPYTGPESLTVEALVEARNKFASRIPGPADGSYMTTVTKLPSTEVEGEYIPFVPEYRPMRIGERPWIEMSGFWDVVNYVMGGPFVSYTTVNQATQEVITLDCYVYSPKNKKRNLLRDLQHMVYVIDFPQDKK